jgi:hypothetical protein
VPTAARRRFIRLTGVGSAVGLLVFAGLYPGGFLLSVTPVAGGRPLVAICLQPGERFTIRYYHSVEDAPIWETHSIGEDGRIYIEEERYLKFGAGMGKMPGVGRMERRGPYEVITDMHMPTGDFVLRIGSTGVDHTLIWRGREKNLSALAPHMAVQFSARPVSWLHRLWYQQIVYRDQGDENTTRNRS